jgi:hypothetical protein
MTNWRAELNQKDLKKVFDKVREMEKISENAISTTFLAEGLKINREQKKYAPIDTGNLVNNIVYNIYDGGKEVLLESRAKYSKLVEFGRYAPKVASKRIPFFYPPLEAGRKRIINTLEKLIEKATK